MSDPHRNQIRQRGFRRIRLVQVADPGTPTNGATISSEVWICQEIRQDGTDAAVRRTKIQAHTLRRQWREVNDADR